MTNRRAQKCKVIRHIVDHFNCFFIAFLSQIKDGFCGSDVRIQFLLSQFDQSRSTEDILSCPNVQVIDFFTFTADDDVANFTGITILTRYNLAIDDQCATNTSRMGHIVDDLIPFTSPNQGFSQTSHIRIIIDIRWFVELTFNFLSHRIVFKTR